MAGYSKSTIARIITNVAISSSYATSASYTVSSSYAENVNAKGEDTQIQFNSGSVFSGSQNLIFDYNTNNLILTGSFNISGSFSFNQTLTTFAIIDPSVGGENTLVILDTGSYRSAFTKYSLYSGSNSRAGEFVTVWNGTTTQYYDNSTTDIGNTSIVTFSSFIINDQLNIIVYTPGSPNWVIKSLITLV